MRFLKTIIAIFIISLASFVLVKPVYAATVIAPASISTNTTWTSDNVYVVQTSTTVQSAVTLTIQAGTVVKFNSSAYLNIKGTLQASGTSDNNIVFTSYKDDTYGGDTNGDGTTTTPAKGDWRYLESDIGASVNCSYCRLRYGGKNYSMLYSNGGALNIDHCIIEKSYCNGIEIKGSANIDNNQVNDYTEKGIYVASGSPVITNNTITGGKYGIYVLNGSPNINSNTLSNNSVKSICAINGTVVISGNIINGGDLTDNYGIAVENGAATIENNSISHFPNHEAVVLGKLYGTGSVSGNISGNTMSTCKYPLGFVGDKISAITFEPNDISGCSLHGIYLNVELAGTQSMPVYSLPYISKNFTVKAGADVSIAAGTIIKTTGYGAPLIYGKLTAQGEALNPIVITSLKDDEIAGDTNNDGNASSPQPYDWMYVSIGGSGICVFDYVNFRFGYNALDISGESNVKITNCDISRMSNSGIYLSTNNTTYIENNTIHDNGKGIYSYISSPQIKNNDIHNNGRGIDFLGSSSASITNNYIHNNSYGIYITMDSSHQNNCQIDHNNIESNTDYGLYTRLTNNPPVVVAQFNWWGDPSGANPAGSGDKINSITKIDASNPLPAMYVPAPPEDGARQFCRHYDPETREWSLVLEPVDSGTGAHVIDKGLISLNGARSIDFNLTYNSLLLYQGVLGKGWYHNHETRLDIQADGSIQLSWSENRNNSFTTTDQINYTSADNACRLDSLVKNADGSYTLTRKDQSQYLFNAAGQLTAEKNSTGQTLQMAYDSNGRLQSITEPITGISLTLSYNASGLLQSITDNASRQWQFTYDTSNNLTAIIYPDNTSSAFTYDASGQVLTETDPEGNLMFSNTYDTQGRVVSQDDALSSNQLSTLTYDESSQPGSLITTITDRNGSSRQYIHDSSYQLVQIIDELGNANAFTYDADGNRTSITDALGHTTNMTYDQRGNVLTSTDADGKTTTMTYDDKNNLLTVQNPAGQTTTFVYDSSNRLTSVTDPDNHTTTYTYDSNGRLTAETSPRGGTATYTYVNGLLQNVTDPTNRTTSFAYDVVGRLTSTTNAAGKTTSISCNVMDEIVQTTDPLGNAISFTYDANGKVLTQTDARSSTTTYTYDANRNLASITDAMNNITSLAYDGEDRLTGVTDPRGNQSTITYDAQGRKTAVTDALGHSQTTEYDAADNVVGQYDALNHKTADITYDSLNRPVTIKDALNNVTRNSYDSLGRLIQTTDPLNKNTQFSYDNLNRLIQTIDALNGQASQEFDTDGNRTAVVDANNNRQEYTFDLAGRMTTASSNTGTLQYNYDQIGLLSSLINGRSQTRSLQYDDAGRPVSQTDPDGTISCTYDGNGNLLTVTDASGIITRQYDALNRVISYTDARGNTIGYTYDAAGNLTCLRYPDNKAVNYTYDAANRLTQVEDWAGRTTSYTYDANNRLVSTQRPDGSVETRSYDNAGRLIQQVDKDVNNNILTQFDFTYNAAGNITAETNNLPEVQITDEINTLTYTSDNRLDTYNGASVQYDADGNMTSGALNGQITAYTFNSRNQLTAVGTSGYTYDAEGNRIAVNLNGIQYTDVINPNAALSQLLVRTGAESQTFYVYGLGLNR